jgi:3-phenylpropionate/trans-cinnamate dioxygenase ferredoxin reductase component
MAGGKAPESNPGVVIVGAGYAAGELAIRLRQNGYTAPVTIIGAEPHLPYHRPPLSKAFLAGDVSHDTLPLRPAEMYVKLNIVVRGGVTVTAIDRAAKTITVSTGENVPYGILVLATGGEARRLTCPGADLAGVYTLRTLDDSAAIGAELHPGRRLVIIGGGYIGLEVAAIAVKRGALVTVVEAAPRVLARVAGAELAAFYAEAHGAAGVTIQTGITCQALLPAADNSERVGAVLLANGTVLPADAVVAGVGLRPHTELAEAAGLKVENGIWVDAACRTEDPDIFAIGDCSNQPHALLGRRVRLESVPNALEQARVAADIICGKPGPKTDVPWFWSDQYDLKLQSAGLSEGHDSTVLRGDLAARAFLLFYLRDGTLIAVDAVNRTGEFMVAKRLIGAGVRPDPLALADVSVPLKSLLAS